MGNVFASFPPWRFAGNGVLFVHGGDATGRKRGGGMVLSCCRPRGTGIRKNAAAAIWQ